MPKTIIKLRPNNIVTIENNLLIIETKENTTTENSDVAKMTIDVKVDMSELKDILTEHQSS